MEDTKPYATAEECSAAIDLANRRAFAELAAWQVAWLREEEDYERAAPRRRLFSRKP